MVMDIQKSNTGPTDEELNEIEEDFNSETEAYELWLDDNSVEEIEDVEVSLIFADEDIPYTEALEKSEEALANYEYDEILDYNGMTDSEVLGLLYHEGHLGLPEEIEDEDDEEPDLFEEED